MMSNTNTDNPLPMKMLEGGAPMDDPRAFRRCLGQYPTGVAVMTSSHEGRLVGMSANSFAALSLDPPLVLWSIRKQSASLNAFSQATHFAVNVLADNQTPIAMHFATPSDDKFFGIQWSSGLGGAPLLEHCLAHFECRLHESIEAGDHILLIGLVERYARYQGEPLLFSQGRYAVSQEHPALTQVEQTGSVAKTNELPFNLEVASLLRLTNFAAHRLSSIFNQHFEDQGMGEVRRRLLGWLRHGPRTTEELMQLTFLGEGIVTDELQFMARDGDLVYDLLGRYSLTDHGQEKAEGVARQVSWLESKILQNTKLSAVQEIRNSLVQLACLAELDG